MVITGTRVDGAASQACSLNAQAGGSARSPPKPGKEVATFATSRISIGATGAQARDDEGHRDAMIAVAVDASG